MIQNIMSVRVGRISHPEYKIPYVVGFTPILVMTDKFPGEYNRLSPFYIKDQHGRIMENVWQFSRVFPLAFSTVRSRGFRDKSLAKTSEQVVNHIDPTTGELTDDYFKWRQTGSNFSSWIRYSNGFHDKRTALYAYLEREPVLQTDTIDEVKAKIDLSRPVPYVESRKLIYIPLYISIVKQQDKFATLQARLAAGENLLILEVDGPHQESLPYYQKKYGVPSDFIVNNTMLATRHNLAIMMNDSKHNFGHGYCLAMALQDISVDGF